MAGLHDIPTWSGEDGFHVVVEAPRGSHAKLKYQPDLGTFAFVRPLPLGLSYPYDWGFVPGTRAPDGDPVDALVLFDHPGWPGLVIPCQPLGVLGLSQQTHGGGRVRNDRVIAVPTRAPAALLRPGRDLPPRIREELERFFLDAVAFEDKAAVIEGWEGPDAARALLRRSQVRQALDVG